MSLIVPALVLVLAYLIGAMPSGKIIARAAGVDITAHGSGNVGATNVARVVGKRAGLLTLVLDILKGAAACLLAKYASSAENFHALAALAAVLGHCISLPPKLKGGKGVAASLGVALILAPRAACLGVAIFGLVFAMRNIVSLASISAALSIPIFAIFMGAPESYFYSLAAICLLIVFKHRENIKRLIEGREPVFKSA